jgi:hypothetical protein
MKMLALCELIAGIAASIAPQRVTPQSAPGYGLHALILGARRLAP